MIRAEVYSRDTGRKEVVFHEGTDYEIFEEHELWGKTLARWAKQGISVCENDVDGIPMLRHVEMSDEDFPVSVKSYIEMQFGNWYVKVMTP